MAKSRSFRNLLRSLLATVVLMVPSFALAQIKAFPQAEGYGAAALGGRGGDVYHVTNLTDAGAGSLRFGLENAPTSGRTIVFDVGGWINLTSKLGINSDRRNITIAGQTAPGGVGVRGNQFSIGGDDVVVRHMRFRPGKSTGSDTDSAGANVDAQQIIYDHISAEFSTDGGFDSQATDLTLQFSSVSYGLQTHSTGSLLENAHRLTMHHNLYAHNDSRNPKHRVLETLDWVNNVDYNWDDRAFEMQGTTDPSYQWTANVDGNYFIAGANHGGVKPLSGGSTQNNEVWFGTNAYDGDSDSIHDGKDYSYGDPDFLDVTQAATRWKNATADPTPFPVADPVWKDASSQAAYERVLEQFGATPWARDEVNTVLHDSVVNRTGSIITRESDLVPLGVSNAGFGTIGGGVAPTDTDGDGIPNSWEAKHGTNPLVANNNGDFDQDGFTDLEEYLNDLAAFAATGPLEFTGVGRYADWKRWTNRWEPSRVDDVHINDGAAFVDAVGQKAGALDVGHDASSNARLYVTSGWLDVTDDLSVGVAGVGSIRQYGGEVRVLSGMVEVQNGDYQLRGGALSTPLLAKGANGNFDFTGGQLHADVVAFDLENEGGAIAPGQGIGDTSVLGDLTLTAGSLEIDLASSVLSDMLAVDGRATLGGALNVSLLGGFAPANGQSWEFLAADTILGAFNFITPGYSVQQVGNSLWLQYGGAGAGGGTVPEPSSLMLLVVAAASMVSARRLRRAAALAIVCVAAGGFAGPAKAVVVKTIADAQLSENGTTGIGDATDAGNGTGTSINARWIFSGATTNRNEWAIFKFDLSAYPNKAELANVSLRTYMNRTSADNNKALKVYALTPGTSGENWNEGSITYGTMPGFTFDANSTTNILSVGAGNPLKDLGAFTVSGVGTEGNLASINPASLTSLIQGMGSSNLLTVLLSTSVSSQGQWRVATREAAATATNVLTGSAGDLAAFLQFDIVDVTSGVQGDYNDDGIVNAADYTVWRDKIGGSGLINEEVSPGEIDIADYLYWKERFGASNPGGAGSIVVSDASAVPEPGAFCLLFAAALATLAMPRVGR